MSDLFNFDDLMRWLDGKGFPLVESIKGYRVVKGIDFEKEFKAGNIPLRETASEVSVPGSLTLRIKIL